MIEQRELTRTERQQVKALVHQCANYDRPSALCLLLDTMDEGADCPMLSVRGVGKACGYFKRAVLPLDPELEAALTGRPPAMERRQCAVCGKTFTPKSNRAQYCGDKCKAKAKRDHDREWRKNNRNDGG